MVSSSATVLTSDNMASASVFARSVVKVLLEAFWAEVEDGFADDCEIAGFAGAAGVVAGTGVSAAGAGGGVGLLPPMLSEIVGAGAGASVCSGRATGSGGCC